MLSDTSHNTQYLVKHCTFAYATASRPNLKKRGRGSHRNGDAAMSRCCTHGRDDITPKREQLCERVRIAAFAAPLESWTESELTALTSIMETVGDRLRAAEPSAHVIDLAGRRRHPAPDLAQ